MVRIFALAAVAAACVLPTSASAQLANVAVEAKTANLWTVHATDKGCKVVVSVGAMYGFANPKRVTWSGACGANGLAQGDGELDAVFVEEGIEIKVDYHGSFSGGLMQGPWKFASWETQVPRPAGAGVYSYMTMQDGCMTSFEKEPVRSTCRMVAGRNAAAGAANRPAPGALGPAPNGLGPTSARGSKINNR